MNASANANRNTVIPTIFRCALFAAALSLAAYIPYKYATQLHAITGLYAFLFPLASVLVAAGMLLAMKPGKACDCSTMVRSGVGAVAALWMVTGVLCIPSLMEATSALPESGLFATFHMTVQHVFLSLSILAFAFAPRTMAKLLGVPIADGVGKNLTGAANLQPSR